MIFPFSTDGGQNWKELPGFAWRIALVQSGNPALVDGACALSFLIPAVRSGCTLPSMSRAPFRTDVDSGETWKPINRGLRLEADIQMLRC